MRAQTNFVNTSIDHYPECDCDGTCPKCADEMAGELLSVLAVLNCCQYEKDPYQLELKEGGVAELVAKAVHIRDAYGDQPMQVTEVDLDDMD